MYKFLFFTAITAVFIGCEGSGNTPDGIAKDFIMAVDSRDTSAAMAAATPESAAAIRLILSMLPAADSKTTKHIQLDKLTCKVSGEKAICQYCCDANGRDQALNMVQKDGAWRVTMQKDVPNFVQPNSTTEPKADTAEDSFDANALTDTLR